MLRPFGGHGLGQHLDAAFGGGVRRNRPASDCAGERADVDDLAAASALDHAPRRFASDLECGGEMRFQDPAPFAGRDVEHRFAQLVSGIVDEDVDREALAVEMLEGGADGRFVRDVEGARKDAAAVRFEGLRRGRQFFLVRGR